MNKKNNPLNLNKLQIKTLAVFKELAFKINKENFNNEEEITLFHILNPHGNHLHIGNKIIKSNDASGLSNPSVWKALERKGLIYGEFPIPITLTKLGINYNTDIAESIFAKADH